MQDRDPLSESTVALAGAVDDGGVWHAGWAIGLLAGGAILLLVADGLSNQALLSLAFMAAPGVLGALWRPKPAAAHSLLALWAVAAVLAVSNLGGLAGPVAVFCVAPVVACLAIGAAWRVGLGLTLAAVAASALLGLAHIPPASPSEPIFTWLSLIALLVVAGGVSGALVLTHRRAEAERESLAEELAAFQTLMGDLPELALALNADGVTEAVFGQPLGGLEPDLWHGGLVAAADPADRPAVHEAVAEALAQGAAMTAFAVIGTDRRIAASLQRTSLGGLTAILRPVSDHGTAITAPSPEVTRQLTDAEAARREAELGRERAEANANARTRFLANMSHELRTPLNAIMGFSDMMRMKVFGELPPKYAEYAELIHESGAHLLDLVNDVLDMSKIDSHRYTLAREVFDVREALNAALRLIRLQADDAGVRLRAVLPTEPLMVDADKRALKQMALNLLSNAVKFTPRDGTIILTVHVQGGELEMIVADTGMGIADDDLKRIGQPFEQAGDVAHRSQGTGLGLALVEAFAKLHSGGMVLESRLGEGTAATVRMPILAEVAAPVDAAPEQAAAVIEEPVRDPVPVMEPAAPIMAPATEGLPEPGAPAPTEAAPADIAILAAGEAGEDAVQEADGATSNGPHNGAHGLGPLDAGAATDNGLRRSLLSLFRGAGAQGERPLAGSVAPPVSPKAPPHADADVQHPV